MSGAVERQGEAAWALVAHRVIGTWPIGTFLENIAVLADGSFVISVHNQKHLLHVGRDGAGTILASLPASPAGLVVAGDAVFAVAGEPGAGPHHVFRVGLDGSVEERMAVPDTLFLNGFTPAKPGKALTVDSIVGAIIEIDLEAGASTVVLRDEMLTKCSADPMLPGANGIKLGDGAVFVTNTDRAVVLRMALDGQNRPGGVSVIAERLRGDDLALDRDGSLYITNHVLNTLTRLKPDGTRAVIGGPDQGMVGCTACTFTADDPGGLFVTTTGGIIAPLDGVVQPAKLVRLETGAHGRPVGFLP